MPMRALPGPLGPSMGLICPPPMGPTGPPSWGIKLPKDGTDLSYVFLGGPILGGRDFRLFLIWRLLILCPAPPDQGKKIQNLGSHGAHGAPQGAHGPPNCKKKFPLGPGGPWGPGAWWERKFTIWGPYWFKVYPLEGHSICVGHSNCESPTYLVETKPDRKEGQ